MQSESINELATALAKAQGEMRPAVKDSTNPHFRSKYADLASVWDACRDPLSRNGLAVLQTVKNEGDDQILVTTLAHTSGQWISSSMRLPIQKPGAQELGSCLSYCRRYSLASMVGVYQDDDDGETAEKGAYVPKTLTREMIESLTPLFARDPEAVSMIRNKYRCEWTRLPAEKYDAVLHFMKDRRKSMEEDKSA